MAIRYLDEEQSTIPTQVQPKIGTKVRFLDEQSAQTQKPENVTFLQQLGRELVAPFKQINKSMPKKESSAKEKVLFALAGLLGPAGQVIATAPKGEKLKTAGAVGELGAYAIPGGSAAKGALSLAKAGAVAGATMGASSAIRRGETDIKEIAKDTALTATTGAIIPVVGSTISKGVKSLASHTAEGIYKRLIKTPIAQLRAGREEIGQGLLKRGITGNYDDMLGQVQKSISNSKAAVDNIVRTSKAKVDIKPVLSELQILRKQLRATPGETTTAIDRVINQLAKKQTLSLAEAQTLKTNLQKAVNDAFLRKNTTGITQAQKTAAQSLRKQIEKAVPEIAPHNKEIEFGIRAAKRLSETDALSPSKLRIALEIITGTAGGFINPAITAGVIAERLLTSPKIASKSAKVMYKTAAKEMPKVLKDLLDKLGTKIISPKD